MRLSAAELCGFVLITVLLAGVYTDCPLAAQEPGPFPKPEIHGSVLETGTNLPLADAEVTLTWLSDEDHISVSSYSGMRMIGFLGPPPPRRVVGKAMTDGSGRFSFQLAGTGGYEVTARKDSYSSPSGGSGGSTETVVLTGKNPTTEVRLFLAAKGRINGRVMSADTGKPVTGVTVLAERVSFREEILATAGGGSARTAADGSFSIAGIPPGNWVVAVKPGVQGRNRIREKFSEDDVSAVDSDVETKYWPNAPSPGTAQQIVVRSGEAAEIGEIAVHERTPYYRARVSLTAPNCSPNDRMEIWESSGGKLASDIPCFGEFLLTGFQPGLHKLAFSLDKGAPADRERAMVPFAIRDENASVAAAMSRGVDIEGSIVLPQDSKAPVGYLRLAVLPERLSGPRIDGDGYSPARTDPEGKFRLVNLVANEEYRLSAISVPSGYYVKEMRYNGATLLGGKLTVTPGATVQSLQVLLGSNPATIRGTVLHEGKPVANAFIVVLSPSGEPTLSVNSAVSDDKGNFQLPRQLGPGEYRVLAFPSMPAFSNRPTGTVARLAPGGSKVELVPGASEAVDVELSEVR